MNIDGFDFLRICLGIDLARVFFQAYSYHDRLIPIFILMELTVTSHPHSGWLEESP